MPRPLTKSQLLDASAKEFQKLDTYLASLTSGQMSTPSAPSAWSVKDVLAHLYEWQQMLFTWYETGLRGETPAVPAPGYKWNQLPALNQFIYEKHQQLSARQALNMFRESHQKTIQFIENLSDADLSMPGLYSWMKQNTLMAYLNANTAAHYVWALKEVKKVVRPKEVKE